MESGAPSADVSPPPILICSCCGRDGSFWQSRHSSRTHRQRQPVSGGPGATRSGNRRIIVGWAKMACLLGTRPHRVPVTIATGQIHQQRLNCKADEGKMHANDQSLRNIMALNDQRTNSGCLKCRTPSSSCFTVYRIFCTEEYGDTTMRLFVGMTWVTL